MFCTDISSPIYFIFSRDVPGLLYYSHIPAVLIALFLGLFIFFKNKKDGLYLLLLNISFALWVFINLITWTNNNTSSVLFSWSFFGSLFLLIFLFSSFLLHSFVFKKELDIKWKFLSLVFITPFILLTSTKLNLGDFIMVDCGPVENQLYTYSYYLFGLLFIIANIVMSTIAYKKASKDFKKQILIFSLGLNSFLTLFLITSFVASVLYGINLTYDKVAFSLEQYGLFGMTIFVGFLAYMIVKFKAFNIKLLGAQALVYTLVILIGSQLFFVKTTVNTVLTSLTLLLSVIFGFFLIKGVKREVAHREEIEKLAKNLDRVNGDLELANERLQELDIKKTEFVSLASHQLRSPLTAIKGYSSMILEGSFGEVGEKTKDAVTRIFESSQKLVSVIEDFLNITRIELGRMKYDLSEFSLNTLVNNVIGEQKPNIEHRGLAISYEEADAEYKVYADMGKISQVISNLVDNAAKYSQKGSIKVKIAGLDDKGEKKVRLSVTDTGVGIDPLVMPNLFQKFSRASDASKTNIIGTGLGLYVAKQIIDAHPGSRIWAESEGKGKGSTFFVEFPLSTGVAPIIIAPANAN